jgi:predicted ABC-type transport system involved in lysophospholipase L1 biosynthesis ATPase subunit
VAEHGVLSDVAASRPAIRADGVRRVFPGPNGPLRVLDGLDLLVEEGECIAVVGPSGCGKSTLLHVLGGLDEGWTGRVEVCGLALGEAADGRRAALRSTRVGFVFQDYALLEDMTALDNVALPRYLLRPETLDRSRARAGDLLDRVGMRTRAAVEVGRLSGGERQRVAMARALVNDPSIMLCDEPTGNLDEDTGERIAELLASLRRERGLTVVAATHDRRLEETADRVLWLLDGRLRTEAPS